MFPKLAHFRLFCVWAICSAGMKFYLIVLIDVFKLSGLSSMKKAEPIARCRVLELGCAGGGNLIPMASHLPQSEFVGVDLSVRQVEQASKNDRGSGFEKCPH